MKTTILLIRHGQSEANLAGLFTGHSGYTLTELGHMQAARTAEYIKENYPVSVVYSSDLPRAFQTAEKIAKSFGLPITTSDKFREIFAGDWEDKLFDCLNELYPKDYALWREDIGNSHCTNGETVLQVAERMVHKIREVASIHEGACIAIASHATPIRATLWKISGMSVKEMQNLSWGNNCAVSELVYENGRLYVQRANYDGHLLGLQSSLPKNI